MPSLSNPQPLVVTSEEIKNDLHLSADEIARAWSLLRTFEWRALDGGGGNAEQWSCQIDVEEVRHYRDVTTVDDYLAARREAHRPQLAPLPPLPSFKLSPAVAAVAHEEAAMPPSVRPPRFVGRLRHPIIVAVASTVVGGLVLAAILAAIHLI